jgi:hypothetical protein
MGPVGIAAVVAAVKAARAAAALTRTMGGIKNARTVGKIYQEGTAAPIAKTQAQITQEGLAKARAAIGAPKSTPEQIARKLAQDKVREAARIRKQGRNTR